MEDFPRVEGLDDILHDLEGSRRLEDRLADDRWRRSGGTIARGDLDPEPGVGRRLLIGCEGPTLRRYMTLLRFEASFSPDDDFGYLIGPASQILEAELGRLLFEPARTLASALVSILRADRRSGKRAAILEDWAGGKVPTTIGIGSLVLLALRRCCEGGEEQVVDFLDSRFAPAYRGLLMSNGPARVLDVIRERFRNPACHGTAAFGESDYQEFVRLAVANRAFSSWDLAGPDPPVPDSSLGILHHHLRHRRPHPLEEAPSGGFEARPSTEPPLARLLSLTGSGTSIELRLGHRHGRGPHKSRDIGVPEDLVGPTYRLGERISIEFEASRPCDFALLDVGTSGSVAVLWPNAWQRDSRIEGGLTYTIPGPESPGLDFILTGRPGLERIVAIATSRRLSVPLMPLAGSPFRVLSDGEIERLADELGRADDRAIASREFLVEG